MGVTKKPAVAAKTARKVKVTYIDAKFAKDAGIPLSIVAKEKLPKRGRPVGSKNKPKAIKMLKDPIDEGHKKSAKAAKELAKIGGSLSSKGFPVAQLPIGATITFEELNAGYVDWEKLAKQLQAALAAEMKENEALEAIVADFKSVVRLDSSFTFWDRLVFLFSGKL